MRYPIFLLALFLCTCDSAQKQSGPEEPEDNGLSITETPFGTLPQGPVTKYTLENAAGMEVSIINYGGIITNVMTPDRAGKMSDVVLGFDDLAGYRGESPYFGAFIGRYGNRLAKGRFSLDGETYSLAINNAPNSLHGGEVGFDKKYWIGETIEEDARVGLRLSGTSPDGEEGYPGNLSVAVTYWLNNNNELRLEYEAETDQATPVNLTNHSYFNLAGAGPGTILRHELMIAADTFTPVGETLIPTGELRPVVGTPFDFTTATPIGERIEAGTEQLEFGGGYDHNFVLNRTGKGLETAARVYEPASGRTLEVITTEPGLQFYSGNFLDGSNVGKGKLAYEYRAGFCLETQHFPDSPNQPTFPNTILQPGEAYQTTTIYRFGVK